ncbi:MAG: hypothetical protein RMH81_09440, partial [Thermomicrobium sp.]|nr:hypothetical protein [Thermomicrobium sp.]
AGYTGVLLGATAVPLWARNALRLGPLFLCSALSSAAAALSLLLGSRAETARARHAVERVERLALVGEIALLEAVRLGSGPVIGRPLAEGLAGGAFAGARASAMGALALHLLAAVSPRWLGRALRLVASLLALGGAFLLRSSIVFGGHRSAEDPDATFEFTRASR